MTKISILIPAYNEEATILQVLQRVREQVVAGVELEVVVVDDGSRDRTADLLLQNEDLYSEFVRLTENRGKGGAVKAGLEKVTGDFVLFQDADLEYDPADYAALFDPVLNHGADIVMGSRLIAPRYTRVHYFWHKLGNRFITLLFNLLNNTTFTDIYSCYLLYRRDLVAPDSLAVDGWAQHAEILSKAVGGAEVIYEVPISYHGRTYAEGKKIKAHHVAAILAEIVRGRLARALARPEAGH